MVNDENDVFPKLYFGETLKENTEFLDIFSKSKKIFYQNLIAFIAI